MARRSGIEVMDVPIFLSDPVALHQRIEQVRQENGGLKNRTILATFPASSSLTRCD
jgi:hypothetical protein